MIDIEINDAENTKEDIQILTEFQINVDKNTLKNFIFSGSVENKRNSLKFIG